MRIALLLIVIASSTLAAQTPMPPPGMQVPPQLLEFETRLNKLAIELAAEPVVPISLDADGSRLHGVLYDRVMLGTLAAKALIAEGKTPVPDVTIPGAGLAPNALVVVALPIKCADRVRVPKNVVLISGSGRGSPAPIRQIVPSPSLEAVIAKLEKPANAAIGVFLTASLLDARVEISYDGAPCDGTTDPVSLTIRMTPGRPVRVAGVAALPPEARSLPSPTVVRIQFYADASGRARQASLASGPIELQAAAIAHASQWQFEPARVNGTPIAQMMTVQVSFTVNGAPAPAPSRPTPPGPGDVTMSSNGPLGTGTTPSVPGLTRASSACAVSDDPAYGTTPQTPIKVGGGVRSGPARERQYLLALRGPDGQGVTFRREGSLKGPENTFLDRYAVTYAGVEKPATLFLDEYRWDELKAPSGFVCATPFGLTPPNASPSVAPPPSTGGVTPSAPPPPESSTAEVANLSASTSQCAVANDAEYAVTPAKPIAIGGGLALEERFMALLRGSSGQGTRYRRIGAGLGPDRQTMLSSWELTYSGLPSPVRVYFDRSKTEDPQAPKGFTCSAKFAR